MIMIYKNKGAFFVVAVFVVGVVLMMVIVGF